MTNKLCPWPQWENIMKVPEDLNEAMKILQRRIEFVQDPDITLLDIDTIFNTPPTCATKEELLNFLKMVQIVDEKDLQILIDDRNNPGDEFKNLVKKIGQETIEVEYGLQAFAWAYTNYHKKRIRTSIVPAPIVKVWMAPARCMKRELEVLEKKRDEFYSKRRR